MTKRGPKGQMRKVHGKAVVKAIEDAGGILEITGSGHVKIVLPQGRPLVASLSPSDHRGRLNFLSELRKAGVNI